MERASKNLNFHPTIFFVFFVSQKFVFSANVEIKKAFQLETKYVVSEREYFFGRRECGKIILLE